MFLRDYFFILHRHFFNDPFDSALPSVPEVTPTIDERKSIIEELKQIHKVKKEDIDRLLICDDFDTSFMMVLNKMGISDEIQDEIFKTQKKIGKRYKEEIATVCFSEINNSDLMWAHYANSYSGFCVAYDFTKILDPDFRRGIGKVIYSDKRPNEREFSNNYDYTKAVLATKAPCWEYEKEWRSVQYVSYKLYSKKIYPIFDVKDCITSVYLGCNMPLNYQEEIICHYKNSSVKVYNMVLDEDEFKYKFVQCN